MWSHSACFSSVGWVKLLYEVLLPVVYAIFGTVICVFLLTCVLFLCCFPSCFLVFSCLCVCLLALYCNCLSVLCCYLLSVSCSILNIGLLGSMALSAVLFILYLYYLFIPEIPIEITGLKHRVESGLLRSL
jgi:hypothetical protein